MRIIILLWVLCCISCSSPYKGIPDKYYELLDSAFARAGNNAPELKKALDLSPAGQKEAMAFLIAYMPDRDLTSLNSEFLLNNVAYAYKAKEQFAWGKEMPDSIFYNEVLPYVTMNETREDWRADFFDRFSKYVAGCKNIFEAIDSVNRNIRNELMVDYNTKRERPDQSPSESIRQGMASCSGLSILLTDAFRAVGIPSRIAGTPNWHDDRGNHNWCEVWADGKWYFTEYYPDHLNQSWFLADAGKASKQDLQHAIYASSFKPAEGYFPLVWDEDIRYVHAENVTDRYVELYQNYESELRKDGNHVAVKVMMFKQELCTQSSEGRVAVNVDVFCGADQIGGGRTVGPTQDMNDVLEFILEKDKVYTFKYTDAAGNNRSVEEEVGEETKTVKLYME